MREEIVREITGPEGDLSAVLTRNAYGAVVLNAARAFFIDVDLPKPPPPSFLKRFLQGLFGGVEAVGSIADRENAAQAKRQEWLADHRQWGLRVYRTRSGLRYLVTHALFEPGSADSEAAMHFLGCDPNYQVLCRAQKSFRARLAASLSEQHSYRCSGCGKVYQSLAVHMQRSHPDLGRWSLSARLAETAS